MRSAIVAGLAIGGSTAVSAQALTTWDISATFYYYDDLNTYTNDTVDGYDVNNQATGNYDAGNLTGSITVDSSGNVQYFDLTTTASGYPSVGDNAGSVFTGATYTYTPTNQVTFPVGTDLFGVGAGDMYFVSDTYNLDTLTGYILDLYVPDLSPTGANSAYAVSGGSFNYDGSIYEYLSPGCYTDDYSGACDTQGAYRTTFNTDVTDFGETFSFAGTTGGDTGGGGGGGGGGDVPEPTSLALLGAGLISLGAIGRRFRRRRG